jgi:aquaporin Z
MSFGIMATVLVVSNHPTLRTRTGICCGALVAVYITVFAPISGMSINPARSFASAVPARALPGLWLYFAAPLLGMLTAAEVYVRVAGFGKVYCAKLHHTEDHDCIFRCGFCELKKLARRPVPGGPAHETVSNSNLGAAGRP